MARPLRIEYPGAWYHVMNRGAGRGRVFPGDGLRLAFLDLLSDVHERFGIRCHAYCLMENHDHLLLNTPDAGLGRAMQHLDGVYTQRHNRRCETDGPLFRGRYKAQLVEAGDYLWMVSRYVHRNPVDAGLCASPSRDYEIPESRPKPEAAPEAAIIDALCAARGWRRKTLAMGADKIQRQHRAMLMRIVLRHTPARLAQVAAAFDLHYSTAASAISRVGKLAARDREVAAQLHTLRALLRKWEMGRLDP